MSFVVAAVASAGAGLVGAFTQANAAENAAYGQSQAALGAQRLSQSQFDQNRLDQMPWLQAGGAGVTTLAQLLGLGGMKSREQILKELTTAATERGTPAGGGYTYGDGSRGGLATRLRQGVTPESLAMEADKLYGSQQANTANAPLLQTFKPGDLVNEPGYQFGLGEDNKTIERAAKARGTYMAAATVKELLRYGQDYAGTKYNDAYNRFNQDQSNIYNRLAGISGTGQSSAQSVGGMGMANAQNVGNLMTGAANARGAAGMAGANAWSNALTGGANAGMQGAMLSSLFKPGGTPGYNSTGMYGGTGGLNW